MKTSRQKSAGFIVIDTRTGEILSGLFSRREPAREKARELHGKAVPNTGVHHVMLWPGETYSRETYRP